jgi:stage II sporulation protein R
LGDCADKEEAVECVNASRDVILDAAAEVLSKNGVDYGADMLVGQENYPERVYDGAAYPAGEYTSVRVVLGEGEGQNWWCVLFPPLCLSAALEKKAEATLPLSPADRQDGADDAVEVGITDKQYGIITETQSTPKYRLKFKLFELIAELFE